ncbi:MAG: sulfite exporter TauE/SafE family protein, partial [Candidatus Limnocylindria bacterium]
SHSGHGPSQHGHPHSHDPDTGALSLRSLVGLGVSGGLLPCPTALVVLLAAVSFHNVALGMTLVLAFSVGLAAVLTGIGLLMVGGGRRLSRSSLSRRLSGSSAVLLLPALSAGAIAIAGIVIAVDAVRGF